MSGKRSKGRAEFGKGAIEGVAGPEAANNASFSGVLVPLLTLGLPTSATAAVLHRRFPNISICSRDRSSSITHLTLCGR